MSALAFLSSSNRLLTMDINMNNTERKILIKAEVKKIIRVKSDSSFQEMINAGEFPRGFRIGLRRLGWYEDEINAWLKARELEARGEAFH